MYDIYTIDTKMTVLMYLTQIHKFQLFLSLSSRENSETLKPRKIKMCFIVVY